MGNHINVNIAFFIYSIVFELVIFSLLCTQSAFRSALARHDWELYTCLMQLLLSWLKGHYILISIFLLLITLVFELLFKFHPRIRKNIGFLLIMVTIIFSIISAVISLDDQKESNEFKSKFAASETENLKLKANLIKLQASFSTEINKVKNITASLQAKITGDFSKENFPFRVLRYLPNLGLDGLVMFPKQGANMLSIELAIVDQVTFSDHENKFTTFSTNFSLTRAPSILNDDGFKLNLVEQILLFIPIENWAQTNHIKLILEDLYLEIKVNGKHKIVVNRKINQEITIEKYSNNTGRVIFKLMPSDFVRN